MNFEQQHHTDPQMIDHIGSKYESQESLNLPITEEQLREQCEGIDLCERALESMLGYSIRYANDVWEMKKLIAEKANYTETQWAELFDKADSDRSRLHNTLIDSIAILSRQMNENELDIQWVKKLAPAGKLERVSCGRFAIMLTYSKYVNSSK